MNSPLIVFDTNVVSELAKPYPDQRVRAWASNLQTSQMAIAATTLAELWFGILKLPDGRRRNDLERRVRSTLRGIEILPFDAAAAYHYAEIAAMRRAKGRAIATFDAQIAAIAMASDFPIASRDNYGFDDTGVEFINPWNHRP